MAGRLTRKASALAFAMQTGAPITSEMLKPPKKRGSPEHDLQVKCCEWLDTLPATLYWSTPNGIYLGKGHPGKIAYYMERLKKAGFKDGATDLNVLFRNLHGAMTLVLPELKVGYNKSSPDQDKFMDEANAYGAYTGVVKSVKELEFLLFNALHPALHKT